jgi:hypothetical protein
MAEHILDVSELEPPEPLELTLTAVERLTPGDYLRMRHRRFPCLLFDRLDSRGYGHLIRGGHEAACEVFIWRRGDPEAESQARTVAGGLPTWRE